MRRNTAALWSGFAIFAASACGEPDARVLLLELPVTNMTRAIAFYQATFGWEVSRPDSAYAILDAQPVAIGLMRRDSAAGGGTATIVIGVRDLDGVFVKIVPNGGLIRQPIGPSWRGRQFRMADPDGNEMVVWSDRDSVARRP